MGTVDEVKKDRLFRGERGWLATIRDHLWAFRRAVGDLRGSMRFYLLRTHAHRAPPRTGAALTFSQADPIMDRVDRMTPDSERDWRDTPSDQILYRARDGRLLTSSMIALGWGAGQSMTPAARIDEFTEGIDLLEQLDECEKRSKTPLTEFEIGLRKAVQEKLSERWTK